MQQLAPQKEQGVIHKLTQVESQTYAFPVIKRERERERERERDSVHNKQD